MEKPNKECKQPVAKIVVQPYEDSRSKEEEYFENRFILGADSTWTDKTYLIIRVLNYVGPVAIRMSCVSAQAPHRPHPYKLVGSQFCKDGVYKARTQILEDSRECAFKEIVIQRVKRSAAKESLALRKLMNVDPFRTGFDCVPSDYESVCLAIEVFLPDAGGRFRMPLPVLVTEPLAALETAPSPQLVLSYVSHASGSARGGTCIALFTDNLPREGLLTVRFSEAASDWTAEVRPRFIHKMCAMVVETPPYWDPDTREPAEVMLELCWRPAGGGDIEWPSRSSPVYFLYEPEWRPAARRRRNNQGLEGSTAKQRRVDEKELDDSLFGGSDVMYGSLPSGIPVESIFREVGERKGTSVSLSEASCTSEPSQCSSSGVSSSNQSSSTGARSPIIEQTPQRRQPDMTGQSAQMGHAPLMKQSPNMGQSPHMGLFLQTVPPCRDNQSPQVGQSPQVRQSTQMGPYLQTGSAPQMKQSPQAGLPFCRINQSPQVGQSPQVRQSTQMGPSLQTGPAPQMKQSPQAGLPLQTEQSTYVGQPPQMRQSPQMGQALQSGQSPLMNQSYQMGQYLQHNGTISYHTDGFPQFSPDLPTSPEKGQFVRMQQFSDGRERRQSFPMSPSYPTTSNAGANAHFTPASSRDAALDLQQQLLDQQRFEPVSGAEDIHSLLRMDRSAPPVPQNDPNLHNLSDDLASILYLKSTPESPQSPESTGEL